MPCRGNRQAYVRRWRLKMCLDDLKTTLDLDHRRCKSPVMIRCELLVLLIAHNFSRWIMAEVARTRTVPPDRISFTGTLDAFRHFRGALAGGCRPHRRRRGWATLLRALAVDRLPPCPHRRELRVP